MCLDVSIVVRSCTLSGGAATFYQDLFYQHPRDGVEHASVLSLIIWLAPRAGKMNQILRCDWLPERARWSHLACSTTRLVPREKFPRKPDKVCSVKMA